MGCAGCDGAATSGALHRASITSVSPLEVYVWGELDADGNPLSRTIEGHSGTPLAVGDVVLITQTGAAQFAVAWRETGEDVAVRPAVQTISGGEQLPGTLSLPVSAFVAPVYELTTPIEVPTPAMPGLEVVFAKYAANHGSTVVPISVVVGNPPNTAQPSLVLIVLGVAIALTPNIDHFVPSPAP